MIQKIYIPFLFLLLSCIAGYSQNKYLPVEERFFSNDSIDFIQIKSDSIFNSKQIISLLKIPKSNTDRFHIEFNYSTSQLKTTSFFGESKNALAAINGSFFDMDNGGSVAYFEIDDTVINRTRPSELKWGISENIINGAIIITDDHKIEIQPTHSDQYFERSKEEAAVLVSGPLLLLNSELLNLPNTAFVNNRHPRTCLCNTKESVILIAIDGRSETAEGMSLIESQRFLLNIGCIDAINLDGGGSTTMWLKDRGIVNFPSDISGERPVSNALLIVKD